MKRVPILRLLVFAPLIWAGAANAQNPGKLLFPDETDPLVLQWGENTVQDFLAAHQMPPTEVTSIELYGTQDLLDNLRSFAWAKLQLLLADPRTTLDPAETAMVNRFGKEVKSIGIEYLQIAVAEKNRFLSNRCTWQPDTDLSKTSGYTYDGAYNCPRLPYEPVFNATPPASPSTEYFLAYGQKKSWVETITKRPGGTRSIAHITEGGALILGIGLTAALALGTVLPAIGAALNLFKTFSLIANRSFARAAGFWVGVGITIAILIATITLVIYLNTENSRVEAEYPQLDSQLSQVSGNPAPDRAKMADAQSRAHDGQALYAAFLRMVIPTSDLLTPAPLPAPGSSDPQFLFHTTGSPAGSSLSSITFPGWGGERTRARLWRGWILQEALVPLPGVDLTSLNTRFRFQWNAQEYEASRIGSTFAVMKLQPAPSDTDCPIDHTSLVSTSANLSQCRTFVTRDLPMDLEGLGTGTVSITQPVAITSPASAKVAIGEAFAIPITTSGLPEPAISVQGSLPAGFTLSPGALRGTATLNWDGSGRPGTYSIPLMASNGATSNQMTLQVAVGDSVQFTSPTQTSYTLEAGKFVSLPVVATGFPVPTVTVKYFAGACGLQLQQVSGSSYLLSGYLQPAPQPFTCYLQFNAANANAFDLSNPARGKADLTVIITVAPPSAQPSLLTRKIVTPAGLPRHYTIETAGTSAPVTISLTTDANGQQLAPSWVSLQDEGNGTAFLLVNPPAGAPESLLVPLWYRVKGTDGNQAISATDGVTLQVSRQPVFTFPLGGVARFDVGSPVDQTWSAQASDATGNVSFQVNPPLPDGLRLEQSTYGAFTITGYATTAGDYNVQITATNSFGPSTASVRIVVAQAAKITSQAVVNFYMGRNNSFEVTASGFPRASLGDSGTRIPFPSPMTFTGSQGTLDLLRLLPLRFDTQDPVTREPYIGRAVISGNPVLSGKWPFQVTVQTGGLPADTQNLVLVLTQYGDVNSDLTINCGDVSFINTRIGQRRGMPGYDYNADINQDGVIDVQDLAVVSSQLPAGTRCQ